MAFRNSNGSARETHTHASIRAEPLFCAKFIRRLLILWKASTTKATLYYNAAGCIPYQDNLATELFWTSPFCGKVSSVPLRENRSKQRHTENCQIRALKFAQRNTRHRNLLKPRRVPLQRNEKRSIKESEGIDRAPETIQFLPKFNTFLPIYFVNIPFRSGNPN